MAAREIVLEQSQEISVMNAYLGQAGPRSTTTDDVAMDWMGLAVPIARMPGMPTNQEMDERRSRTFTPIPADQRHWRSSGKI